ncbi:class I SAM-dependent methyltransferase [Paenibacillus massiliensis]|uniref:class I SAM-dependent methyltransferase n=1 Tax=Paenibacillus massiliensis TaxID=225917 RepID=UPI0009DE3BF6|nr:class I SAM-dependent methyltransferase [Paenibacillus massiliensis]
MKWWGVNLMYLSPQLYHRFVRPQWFTNKYIHEHIKSRFSIENKSVLDFGCGTEANCSMYDADHYYGVDPDAQRVQFAKRLYPNHTFMVFDKQRIPMPDQTVDFIFIVAVLHHISNEEISGYLHDFSRVMKPEGIMIVIEPYLCPRHKISNWFMKRYDDGEFIRSEDEYLQLFKSQQYDYRVIKKFRKGLLYNEIFFKAALKENTIQEKTQASTSVASDQIIQAAEQLAGNQMSIEEALRPSKIH